MDLGGAPKRGASVPADYRLLRASLLAVQGASPTARAGRVATRATPPAKGGAAPFDDLLRAGDGEAGRRCRFHGGVVGEDGER